MPEPRVSPKVKRRRPGSQRKALRRSCRWLAGWRAGGPDREGELRADGAGLGRAPPPPKDLGTWIARARAVSTFKAEQKEKKKKRYKERPKGVEGRPRNLEATSPLTIIP